MREDEGEGKEESGYSLMTVELEARVVRKISWRILPFVMLLYFVSFLDRVNVGFAALSMNEEIGLTPAMFGLGSGLFFAGYVLFEVPSNLILYRVGVRVWIARVMITWGLVSAACAFVTGPYSFYALRFLLGVAEAGFFPGIIFYLSHWYPVRHRAAATAAFMAAAPLSTAIGSPISGALMELPPVAGLNNWQWLYIVEALPAVVLGLAALWMLTEKPEQAEWLSEEERNWLIATLQMEAASRDAGKDHVASVGRALLDSRVLVFSLIYLGTSAGLYALGIWSPLIFQELRFSPFAIGWINGLLNVGAIGGMVLWARHSDLTMERKWHLLVPCVAGCVGFLLAGSGRSVAMVIFALLIANVGISAAKAPIWAMSTAFLSGTGSAGGIALINSIGNLGGLIGPIAIGWLKEKTGSYAGGLYAVGATLAISAIATLLVTRSGKSGDGISIESI